jgi:hypothetical protein
VRPATYGDAYGGVSGRNGFRFTPLAADGKTGTPQRARFTIVR